jgi:hypothetical protein
MDERFAQETQNLIRSWDDAGRDELRDYLVQDVEDPRINLQSIITRHFLLEQLFPGEFAGLRYQELRFSAVLNWLLQIIHQYGCQPLPEMFLALAEGQEYCGGLALPRYVIEAFAALPAMVDGVHIENYLSAAMFNPAPEQDSLPEVCRDTFKNLWSAVLAGRKFSQRLSVLEPACGSANDYRYIHSFGLARFLTYTGFDLTRANIANAMAMFPQGGFRLGNVLGIAAADKSFDCLIVHDLFEHLSIAAMEQAICEVCRVTRRAMCLGFFRMHDGAEHIVTPHQHYHVNMLSLGRVRELLEARGGQVEAVWMDGLSRTLFGKEDTHNPHACTLIVHFSDDVQPIHS